MKKILTTIFGAALIFAGCNEKVIAPSGIGKVTLDLSYGEEWQTKAESSADVNAFKVTITRPADGWSQTFERFDQMPAYLELGAATYNVTVSSGNDVPAAFDNPVFGGTQTFEVKAGAITPVAVQAGIQNVKVSFNPSDAFLNELSSYTITVSNGDDANHTLVWSNATGTQETAKTTTNISKAGYFSVGTLKLRVDGFRAIDNSTASYDAVFASPSAKDHYVVKLDAKTTGQGGFNITVDTTTNDKQEDVQVPGFNEDPIDGPDPVDPSDPSDPSDPGTDPGQDPTPSDAITFVWAENPTLAKTELKSEGMNVNIKIGVENGIKDFLVKIASPTEDFITNVVSIASGTLDEQGRAVLDLTNPTTFSTLGGLLGITGNTIVGQTSLNLALSGLLPLIIGFSPEVGTVHTFTLDITDSLENNYSADLEFEYLGH